MDRPRSEDIVHPLCVPEGNQPRASLERLASWWQTNGSGLVVVLGIAGCGKTAFAAHFLESVRPRSGAEDSRLPPAPDFLFGFSFRELADPAACLARLKALLPRVEAGGGSGDDAESQGEALAEPLPDDSLLNRIHYSTGRLLILLDALDVVQVPSEGDETAWQIADPKLRELIIEVAAGKFANVVVMVTTRLPLGVPSLEPPDPSQPAAPGSSALWIDLDRFETREDSVLLLRRQGLAHSDALLVEAADACADHPLTLTAFAQAATSGHFGLPTFDSWLADSRWPPTLSSKRSPDTHETLRRFADDYLELLASSLPDALALVEQLRLFERPVRATILHDLVTASRLEEPARFEAALRAVRAMRLLVEHATPQHSLSVHPLLRLASVHLDPPPDRRQWIADSLLQLLVETPHGEPPSDRHRLDLIEEVLRQSLAGGDLSAAWRAYIHHLGGHAHLARCLGDYRRGERVSRALLLASVRQNRTEIADALWYDWLDYLIGLGRLGDAEIAYERWIAYSPSLVPGHALEVRARLLLLQGKLVPALALVERELAEASSAQRPPNADALALRGRLLTLMGRIPEATADFEALTTETRRLGIEYLHLLVQATPPRDPSEQPAGEAPQLRGAAEEALSELRQLLELRWGIESPDCMRCHVLAAELEVDGTAAAAETLDRVLAWTRARGAQELACWVLLTRGRLGLRLLRTSVLRGEPLDREAVRGAVDIFTEGLNIARSCGYGILHIDLLVARGQLLLLAGQAAAAEADAASALLEGVHANRDFGLLEILPASDPACGYRWGEASASNALAEALLLKAAEIWGQPPSAFRSPEDLANDFLAAMHRARAELESCKALRTGLRDPLLRDTERVMDDLARGELKGLAARFSEVARQPDALTPPYPDALPPLVFISYNSRDRDLARELVEALKDKGQRPWFDEDELLPGDLWMSKIEQVIKRADAIIMTVGPSGFGQWHADEMRCSLIEMKRRGLRIIPLLLPNARDTPKLPQFLEMYVPLDMRNGIQKDKLSKLLEALETPPS